MAKLRRRRFGAGPSAVVGVSLTTGASVCAAVETDVAVNTVVMSVWLPWLPSTFSSRSVSENRRLRFGEAGPVGVVPCEPSTTTSLSGCVGRVIDQRSGSQEDSEGS